MGGPKDKNGLTEKQEAFCKAVILNKGNHSEAYRQSYNVTSTKPEVVWVSACKLGANPNVALRIAQLSEEKALRLQKEHDISIEALSKLYAGWLKSDMTEFMELTQKEIKALPLELRQMVTGFDRTEKTTRNADGAKETDVTFKLKFVDKQKAGEMLNKHVGFYEKDNKQSAPTFNNNSEIVFTDGSTDD